MKYLNRTVVETLYANIGGELPVSKGKIDYGKIDQILEKPQRTLYKTEKYDTIYKKAACLFEGFCRIHAFPDGNKRAALLVTIAFLQANDHHLVVPLNTVEFLVRVAQDKGRTEEEIDALIFEISDWLEERTAVTRKEFSKKDKKYVVTPLLKLYLIMFTGVGIFYVSHKLNKWFATDFHPEYRRNVVGIMKFILKLNIASKNASKNINIDH